MSGQRSGNVRKTMVCTALLLLIVLALSGCNTVGDKSASLTIVYAAAAVLSLLLLAGLCLLMRRRDVWFVLLFAAVLVVNIGYFCLSVSASLGEALLANRIAYLGSVLLPLSMFMIMLRATGTEYRRYLPWLLLGIGMVVFFVAASQGYLDIYYKEVSFTVVNGVSKLEKVYGPCHVLYLVYLLIYFALMVGTIVRAAVKKVLETPAHAVILLIAVFVNLGVWLIEQLVRIDFEMLSISYIISELFLLGAHLMMRENQKLKAAAQVQTECCPLPAADHPAELVADATAEQYLNGMDMLTPKERALFEAYVAGKATKDILAELNIKENTLKFHSKNLYGKLGVTSRKQLMAVYSHLCASGRLTAAPPPEI